jgi:hypothetical protein
VFAGGAGFTYGENATMQFNKMGDWTANYGVTAGWKETIKSEGARQMIYLKKLMLSKSYFDRVPAQELVMDNGERYDRVAATRGKRYALFYVYNGRDFKIETSRLKFNPSRASWFNPKNGEQQIIREYRNASIKDFNPPGEKVNGNDWVLILEK